MKFPALPSTNVAVLLLLVAPNAVTAAIRVGGQGAGCCSNAGAQPHPAHRMVGVRALTYWVIIRNGACTVANLWSTVPVAMIATFPRRVV
ncbi:hypothetical protein P3342_000757 [Pyrenophora teres f. teres]|nr:hypothetical protein P3342_000757 [Pyrenophora teres f. teres]